VVGNGQTSWLDYDTLRQLAKGEFKPEVTGRVLHYIHHTALIINDWCGPEVVKRLRRTCEILCTACSAGDFTTAVSAAKKVFVQNFVERLLRLQADRAITSVQTNERRLKQEIEEFSAPRANHAMQVALSAAVLAPGACTVPEFNGRRRDRAAYLELLSGLCHLNAAGLSVLQLEDLGAGGLRKIGGALSKMEHSRCLALTKYLRPEGG